MAYMYSEFDREVSAASYSRRVTGMPECGNPECPTCDVRVMDATTMVDITDMADAFTRMANASISMADSMTETRPKEREMIPSEAVVTIDREEAENQLALYEGLELTDREKNLLAIYDAVAAGEKVIQLETVLKRGQAMTNRGMPQLALAPVTAEKVKFERTTRGSRNTILEAHAHYEAGKKWKYWLPLWWESGSISQASGEALTPLVPPPHRDKVEGGDLFLWEATWLKKKESQVQYDPAVIRPLSNGLYKVVAAWDLTPVEAMALGSE